VIRKKGGVGIALYQEVDIGLICSYIPQSQPLLLYTQLIIVYKRTDIKMIIVSEDEDEGDSNPFLFLGQPVHDNVLNIKPMITVI